MVRVARMASSLPTRGPLRAWMPSKTALNPDDVKVRYQQGSAEARRPREGPPGSRVDTFQTLLPYTAHSLQAIFGDSAPRCNDPNPRAIRVSCEIWSQHGETQNPAHHRPWDDTTLQVLCRVPYCCGPLFG